MAEDERRLFDLCIIKATRTRVEVPETKCRTYSDFGRRCPSKFESPPTIMLGVITRSRANPPSKAITGNHEKDREANETLLARYKQ